jgi:hypothetical protein
MMGELHTVKLRRRRRRRRRRKEWKIRKKSSREEKTTEREVFQQKKKTTNYLNLNKTTTIPMTNEKEGSLSLFPLHNFHIRVFRLTIHQSN